MSKAQIHFVFFILSVTFHHLLSLEAIPTCCRPASTWPLPPWGASPPQGGGDEGGGVTTHQVGGRSLLTHQPTAVQ